MSYIGNSPGVASQRVVTTFTATSGQTTFTPSSGYTLGYCDVFFNGVKLVNGDDYTAADGTSVVLASGAAAGDVIEVVAHFPRGLSDGYLKAEADAKFLAKTGGTLTGDLVLDNGSADGAQVVLKSQGYSNWNIDNYSGRLRAYYNATEYFNIDASGNVNVLAAAGKITKSGSVTSISLGTGDSIGDSTTMVYAGGDSAATDFRIRLYNGGYYYPVSFSNTGPVTASSTSPNYISNRTSPGVGNENGRWEGRAGNAAYSSGIRSFVASGQPGVDRVSAAIFTSTYNSGMQTAIDRLIVDDVGRVTIPNQPVMFAQPDSATTFAVSSGAHIFGWSVTGGPRFNRGFTLSAGTSSFTRVANAANTGRITVPSSGVYLLYFDQRNESPSNTGSSIPFGQDSGSGQMGIFVNGSQVVRRHVNIWASLPYNHCIVHAALNLSAGDYIELGAWWNNSGVTGNAWSGTGDSVNWLYLAKIA